MSSPSQIKGAEESKFILCCDVWLKQQCNSEALQDLGGESPLEATVMIIINVLPHSLNKYFKIDFAMFGLSVTENTQQDKKDLLFSRETHGKLYYVLSFE